MQYTEIRNIADFVCVRVGLPDVVESKKNCAAGTADMGIKINQYRAKTVCRLCAVLPLFVFIFFTVVRRRVNGFSLALTLVV